MQRWEFSVSTLISFTLCAAGVVCRYDHEMRHVVWTGWRDDILLALVVSLKLVSVGWFFDGVG